ncbi:MAG: hypothetical protein KA230_10070 [Flavobacteriales bacterium]|nr:hypothetical protein [Flavobacteriales bacterium]
MRFIHFLVAGVLSVLLLWINIAVHRAPAIGSAEEDEALKEQLAFLEPRVRDGLGAEMQELFPEGRMFTYALYGLAWCGLAERLPASDALRTHAQREALWAYAQIDSRLCWSQFPKEAAPEFGVFYAGWCNYLLARLVASGAAPLDTSLVYAFDRQSDSLARAFTRSDSPFLESYTGAAWPADATVAMASLVMHGQLRGRDHSAAKARWVAQVRERLDERGLIPHAWQPWEDGLGLSARGSSQALMNALLPLIDTTFAAEQFGRFRELYFTERFGVPAVREHPIGDGSPGDVDSGPLILGFGPAATIVGSGACRMNGDAHHAAEFESTVHGFGFSTGIDRKRYVFGALPIADLFIAWVRTMPCTTPYSGAPMFKRFHLWCGLLLLLLWSPVLVRWWRARG